MYVAITPSSHKRYRAKSTGIKPLQPAEERELAERWRDGDAKAGEALIEASLPFVIRVATAYRRWGVPVEDLIQQGNIGLLRAAKKFDSQKNCRLVTYAVYWIRAEIRDYVLRTYRIVRLGTTRTERRAMRTFRRAGAGSAEELATLSGMPVARCEKLWPLLLHGDISLDAQVGDRQRPADTLSSDLADPEFEVMRSTFRTRVRASVNEAFATLSEREQRIVQARVMADEPMTLEELGKEMGVSKERVRQIEERVKFKLRDALAEYQSMAA